MTVIEAKSPFSCVDFDLEAFGLVLWHFLFFFFVNFAYPESMP